MSQASAPAADTPVIKVERLVTHSGPRKILGGIDRTIQRGEIMAIMGGNG